MLQAIYPAYHPVFTADCGMCSKTTNSPSLLADLTTKGRYVCDRCAFTFLFVDARDEFVARDMKELKQYGSLFGN